MIDYSLHKNSLSCVIIDRISNTYTYDIGKNLFRPFLQVHLLTRTMKKLQQLHREYCRYFSVRINLAREYRFEYIEL